MNNATQDFLNPIETIRNLVAESSDVLLDRVPVYENEILEILWMLAGTNSEEKMYADVPIWAVGSLTHLNFAYAGTSWRNLLHPSVDREKEGVTGRGWKNDAFEYFSGSLEEKWFPAQSSTEPLRLRAYGNFVSVTCGVHRAVGAVNFLAATQGSETAALRQAKLTYQQVDQELLDFLKSRAQTEIYLSWVERRNRVAGIRIISATKYGAAVFRYQNSSISIEREWLPLPPWGLRLLLAAGLLGSWHHVAKQHLSILLQPSWLPTANARLRNTGD